VWKRINTTIPVAGSAMDGARCNLFILSTQHAAWLTRIFRKILFFASL
jgi:hypothetical protein